MEAWNISKITCCSLLLSNFPLLSRKSCYRYKYSSFCVVTCSKAVFQCLDVLLKLNHSLVEPHLHVIWKMLWRTECSAGDAHNSLMNSLISTYVKLRQVQHILCTVHLSLNRSCIEDWLIFWETVFLSHIFLVRKYSLIRSTPNRVFLRP